MDEDAEINHAQARINLKKLGGKSLENIAAEQAHKLGGGWQILHGVMPVITLTVLEAESVIQRLTEKEPPVKYEYDTAFVSQGRGLNGTMQDVANNGWRIIGVWNDDYLIVERPA